MWNDVLFRHNNFSINSTEYQTSFDSDKSSNIISVLNVTKMFKIEEFILII